MSFRRLQQLNPLRLLQTNFPYQRLPTDSAASFNGGASPPSLAHRVQWPSQRSGSREQSRWGARVSITRLVAWAVISLIVISVLGGGGYHRITTSRAQTTQTEEPFRFYWEHFRRLNGYYHGVRTLVSPAKYEPENRFNVSDQPAEFTAEEQAIMPVGPPFEPMPYLPYPDYDSNTYTAYHHTVAPCYLDAEERVPTPDIYAYPGLPQHLPVPHYGSYQELGLADDVCFDRFGRLGPYGLGYNETLGGLGAGMESERTGSEKVFEQSGYINWTNMDWGTAQKQCYEKNKERFNDLQVGGKQRTERQAFVLRTYTGFRYDEHMILSLRAMINELALKSGGEYDVHFLVHVKNDSIPIWADQELYNRTLQENVPREFWNISTLWSVALMEVYYPEPFVDNFANMAGSELHGAYRSAHFPLQWWSQQHPEYDHVWNWEMDVRYSGHYYEFATRVAQWAKKQPRKGLWERSRRFWMPEHHGDWDAFTKFVEKETFDVDLPKNDLVQSGPVPIWGPVQDFENSGMIPPPNDTIPPTTYAKDDYSWGVGEEADLLVFNPIFDPSLTNWVFSWDVTGYDRSLPAPPRRAAIITIARLSRRLLNIMHKETWSKKHTMFPEMWPPSVCLHHGLKALYVPHPVYFDRDWDLAYMDQVLNYPKEMYASPFGWGENNLLGSTFYYNSGFSGALWRRWLGQWENGEGGRQQEIAGTGRMCLRPILHHPIKHERGPAG